MNGITERFDVKKWVKVKKLAREPHLTSNDKHCSALLDPFAKQPHWDSSAPGGGSGGESSFSAVPAHLPPGGNNIKTQGSQKRASCPSCAGPLASSVLVTDSTIHLVTGSRNLELTSLSLSL